MRVLVTGGAGYIGSHAVRALSRAGHQPVVLDNLVYGHDDIVQRVLQVPLAVGQVGDREVLEALLRGRHPCLEGTSLEGRPIEAVLHFAAYAYVGESVTDPAKYYRNNLGDTLTLLEALVDDPNVDGLAVQLPSRTFTVPKEFIQSFVKASGKGKPIALWLAGTPSGRYEFLEWLEGQNIVVFPSPERALHALQALRRSSLTKPA